MMFRSGNVSGFVVIGVPESVDGAHVDSIVESIGVVAGSEDEAGVELVVEGVAQRDEAAGFVSFDVSACFDFEAGDRPVFAFDDEIDFLAVVGSPVPERCGLFGPRCLFQKFSDDERFCRGAGSKGAAPSGETVDEEEVFQQRDVAARGGDFKVGGLCGGGDVEHLAGLAGEPDEEVWQFRAAAQTTYLCYVTLQ